MGWSASAIATLVGLCVIAPPLAYAGDVLKRRLKRRRGRKGARLGEGAGGARAVAAAVSYTHLTLPTIYSV